MWFQVNLIYITLLFAVASHFSRAESRYNIVLLAVALAALLMQYTGVNTALFSELRYELTFPLGRFFEMLPCAVLGYFAGRYQVFQHLRRYWLSLLLLSVPLYELLQLAIVTLHGPFGYSGLVLPLRAALFTAVFYVIPFERLPDCILSFIEHTTRYTFGIYCMHLLVGRLMLMAVAQSGYDFYLLPGHELLIYICCYGVSFVLAHLPGRSLSGLVS